MNTPFKATSFLVATVSNEILSDTENQSERLINKYNNAGQAEREMIDSVLMCLCGWTFKTLHEKATLQESEFFYSELTAGLNVLECDWSHYHQSDEIARADDIIKWYNGKIEEAETRSELERSYKSKLHAIKDVNKSIKKIIDDLLEAA